MPEHDVDIDALFEKGNEAALETYLRVLRPPDTAELFSYVDEENWPRIAAILDTEAFAEVIANLDEGQRETLGELLSPQDLVEVVDEMDTDDAADVVADLPDEMIAEVLEKLEDRAEIEVLLGYPEDSAGGIMQTELCRVREDATVSDAIDAIREIREETEDIFGVWVVDDLGRLRGTLELADLVLHPPDTPVVKLTEAIEHTVTAEVDQEEVAVIFRKYDVATLPVIDKDGVLLGRITFDDIHDVIEEEASEDIMAMAGASPEELVYGSDFFRIALFRIPWIISSLLGSLLTAILVPQFSRIPAHTMILTAFVPVIMAMSGNVGSQSAMIITRGLAIGKVQFSTLGRTFLREWLVGLIMGLVAGLVAGAFAHFWHGKTIIGIALGSAMVCAMSAATTIGVAAPALFKRIGIDPAIAAGPLVTTTCDVTGVSVYLVVALIVLT